MSAVSWVEDAAPVSARALAMGGVPGTVKSLSSRLEDAEDVGTVASPLLVSGPSCDMRIREGNVGGLTITVVEEEGAGGTGPKMNVVGTHTAQKTDSRAVVTRSGSGVSGVLGATDAGEREGLSDSRFWCGAQPKSSHRHQQRLVRLSWGHLQVLRVLGPAAYRAYRASPAPSQADLQVFGGANHLPQRVTAGLLVAAAAVGVHHEVPPRYIDAKRPCRDAKSHFARGRGEAAIAAHQRTLNCDQHVFALLPSLQRWQDATVLHCRQLVPCIHDPGSR
ncbi:hypothetical protein NLG97_g3964 [Lecanicillium saksenae]|uniref:Uncharacterized protein n=1 Tax=Lecanicillium saksenae TaxID=468837 RepID=A0ACC1QZA7_9HYPO|nr:hypothetical protein NLG97_g3964 [Lecanicillium saksenae]